MSTTGQLYPEQLTRRETLVTLATGEFIRRFLIHVLPKGFHRIRHYGLLAKGSCADNIARARELLAVAKPQGEPTAAAVDPSKSTCPCCGGRMVVIEVFARGATPRHRPIAPITVVRLDTHDRITIPRIWSSRSPAFNRPRQTSLKYPASVSNCPTVHHARRDPPPIHLPLHRRPTC